MKHLGVRLLFILCLTGAGPARAQNFATYDQFKVDSLQHNLSVKKTRRDSILALQKLVDYMPVTALVPEVYPDHTAQLLKLNRTEKVIDQLPYELLQKGDRQWKMKQYRQALASLQGAIDVFDKQHKVIFSLLMGTRILYNLLNDPEGRLQYYQQKLQYYQINGPVLNTAVCYHSIAGYYNSKGAYNQAINNYLKAADIVVRFDPYAYALSMKTVGAMYRAWGNSKKGVDYLKKSVALYKKLKYTQYTQGYNDLSDVAFQEHRYPEALDFVNKSLQNLVNAGATKTQGFILALALKAEIYLKMNRPDAALPLLKRARTMGDSTSLLLSGAGGFFEIDYKYYEYYMLKGDIPMAGRSLLQAEKLAIEAKSVPLQQKYLKELGYFYRQQKKPVLAAKYFDEFIQLNDAREKGLDDFKVAQYETDQNDRLQQEHINQLKQEKALQNYQLSRRNTLLWISLVVVLLISGLLVLIYRQLNTNKRTLITLRQTQTQLIQSEKMASLGELTAGIAHEIQNPLNFVNNFSEVNAELIDEMQEEMEKGDYEEAKTISNDIKENQIKISQHGKRADFIVKGMLQHSRTSTGERQPTDINVLADEFLKLSYHGLRAKDKSFNVELVTHFDNGLPKVNVVQQDIGRVMLNLFNNAFFAVNEKKKAAGTAFKPEVTVTTSVENEQVIINVKDNGNGIPNAIKDKIMQPFFTTKPAGEGTGLGLSLSYDIVVKGHGGKIEVNTKEGEFTEFIATLPIT